MDNLDQALQHRNPSTLPDNNDTKTTTARTVVGWVKEHLTALIAFRTLTNNLKAANTARESAHDLAERIPLGVTRQDWVEFEMMTQKGDGSLGPVDLLQRAAGSVRNIRELVGLTPEEHNRTVTECLSYYADSQGLLATLEDELHAGINTPRNSKMNWTSFGTQRPDRCQGTSPMPGQPGTPPTQTSPPPPHHHYRPSSGYALIKCDRFSYVEW